MQGNPNPSPKTRFKPGESGNPGGKTTEQRRLEVENAERATRLRNRMLVALERSIAEDEGDDAKVIQMVEAAMLKLLKDSEDRGLGTPVQSVNVDNTSSDGTMTPKDGGSAFDRINSRLDSLLANGEKSNGSEGSE